MFVLAVVVPAVFWCAVAFLASQDNNNSRKAARPTAGVINVEHDGSRVPEEHRITCIFMSPADSTGDPLFSHRREGLDFPTTAVAKLECRISFYVLLLNTRREAKPTPRPTSLLLISPLVWIPTGAVCFFLSAPHARSRLGCDC